MELVVRNCRFSGNRTLGIYGPGGGALVQVRGTLQLDRCLFQDNEAHEMPQFRRRGGAVSCDSATVVISECGFIENFCAGEFDTGGIGGALSADACTLLVQDTVFLRNHVGPSNMGASYGGAVSAAGGTARFTRCLFAGNIAEGWGGAFALYGNDGSGTATFTSCTFADQGAWSGCLFARSGGQVNLEACIISGTDTWYDETYIEPGNWAADVWEPATITCTACNIWDNGADWTGPLADQLGVDGNFSGDPCYCDPDLDDYGLCADSWCAAENNPARPGVLVGALPVSCAACDCGGELLDSGDLPGAAMSHLVDVVPNPFNPLTHVRFEVAQRQPVRIAVYDVAGQEVAVLTDKTYDPGPHEVTWNGQDHRGRAVAAGIYLVRLTSDTGGDVRKAVLVR